MADELTKVQECLDQVRPPAMRHFYAQQGYDEGAKY